MSYSSNPGQPLSLSRRCLTLLGAVAFVLCFFGVQAQAQDPDRAVRRLPSHRTVATKAGRSDSANAPSGVTPPTAVVVTPTNTQGWGPSDPRPGGAVNYVYDAAAPAGFGALQLTTDGTNAAKADYFHAATPGTTLASLNQLSYYTRQVSGPSIADAPYQLPVCLTGGNGAPCNPPFGGSAPASSFTTLVFEPYLNPSQGAIIPGAWQSWDVDQGLFFSTRTVTCSGGTLTGSAGSPLYTLAQINTICPGAVVLAYGVNIGTFNPNYNVETDLFNFQGTVYNFEPNASTITVDDNGVGCNGNASTQTTIQGAVNAANPGDTILVCAGLYPEQVNVNKTLTINGPQAGVDARTAPRSTDRPSEAIVTGAGSAGRTPFYVTANNVTINGFTVEGATDPNTFGYGILLGQTTSGSQILNNIIQNNIIGLGLANNSGANQTRIEQNLIQNNNATGPASGTGIYTDESVSGGTLTNVVINENGFTNNLNPAVLLGSTTTPASQTNIAVSNNDFTANGNAIYATNTANLSITGNSIMNSAGSAVYIEASNGLVFTCNTAAGNLRGIRFSPDSSPAPTTISSGSTVNNNNFVRNTSGGIFLDAGGHANPLNAQNNYYGSPTGPTIASNPGGNGDAIVDPDAVVVYQPYLTVPSTCAPTPPRNCATVGSPYNVVTEFSLGSNPNCEFSYGYTATSVVDSPFTLYNFATADQPVTGIDRWHRDSPDPDLVPAVFHNRNGTTTTYGTVQQPATQLNLHPGQGGERSVVRFTAPVAGRYTITGQFQGLDTGGTTTDVTIVSRPTNNAPSTLLFANNINGFGDVKTFFVTVNLAAGELVDFSVGYGTNLTYGSDSTGLSASISLNGPTAAGVSVSGHVLSDESRGLSGVRVTITDSKGQERSVVSGARGAFTFPDVEVGKTYIVTVNSRKYSYDPIVLSVSDNVTGVEFTPSGQ